MDKELQIKCFSEIRLKSYESFEEYEKNLIYSKNFYIPLAILEVTLRNHLDKHFKNKIMNNWLDNEFLDTYSTRKVNEIKNKFKTNSCDKIISELSFGFWVNLFKQPYQEFLRTTDLKKIFPNLPPKNQKFIDRKYLYKKLNLIRVFRNRIFHYEKVINKKEFEKIKNDIDEILEYFDKNLSKYVNKINKEI